MEKERVKKGERYWYVRIAFGIIEVSSFMELGRSEDESFFTVGNYFHTKEEAKSMAAKLRAVLKGADVIEMPSEKESKQYADREVSMFISAIHNKETISKY